MKPPLEFSKKPPRHARRLLLLNPPEKVATQSIPLQVPAVGLDRSPRKRSRGYERVRLLAPGEGLDALGATECIEALYSLVESLKLPIIAHLGASHDVIDTGLITRPAESLTVIRAVLGACPELDFTKDSVPPTAGRCLIGWLNQDARSPIAPLKDIAQFRRTDPLASLLMAVQPLAPDERLDVCYFLKPVSPERWHQVGQELSQPAPPLCLMDLIAMLFGKGRRMDRFEPAVQRELEARLLQACFEVVGMVLLQGPRRGVVEARARSLETVFSHRFDAQYGGISLGNWRWTTLPHGDLTTPGLDGPPMVLNSLELAALFHPLGQRLGLAGVQTLRHPVRPLPVAFRQSHGLVLGEHQQRGETIPIALPWEDLFAGHCVIPAGATGSGKTTLLERMAGAAAALPDRPNLVILDIHGAFGRDFLRRSLPAERESDTICWEVGDTDFPIGLPLFEAPRLVEPALVAQTVFSTLRRFFAEDWSSTRMEDCLFQLCATLLALPGATLGEASRLFFEPAWRARALVHVHDLATLEFWREYDQLSPGERTQMVRPVMTRIRKLYRTPAVRNVLVRADGLDLTAALQRGTVLVITLDGAAIAAEADALGDLLLGCLQIAIMAQPVAQRRRTFLIVDESQRYQGGVLPTLFREARKWSTTVIAATQSMDAWDESLTRSILANVGSLISFRAGPSDARLLAPQFRPYTAEDLLDLDRYEALVRLQVGGQTQPAIAIRTLPVETPADPDRLARLRHQTRERWAVPRAEVERRFSVASPTPERGPVSHGSAHEATEPWVPIDED